MTAATPTRTALRDAETEFPGLHAEWMQARAAMHAAYRRKAVARLGLPYFPTAAHPHTAVDSDTLYLAQCDAWDAMNPAPVL